MTLQQLENSGFEPNAPKVSVKERNSGKLWHRYGNYALHVNERTRIVTIKRVEQ